MNDKFDILKRKTEMTPFKSEYSFRSFLQNYFMVSRILNKNKREFEKFKLIQVNYSNVKKDFEEKLVKGFKILNFKEWAGTSVSKNPIRLLRIDTTKFMKGLLKTLRKTNTSYEMYNKILYHYYYKYSFIGTMMFFSLPFCFLSINKNFQIYGIYKYAPLLIILCFSGLIADNFGEIGLTKNSIFILFYLKNNLAREDDELKESINQFLKEKNLEFKKKSPDELDS